jgi:tetratricopeptide (TPR) repeat protein
MTIWSAEIKELEKIYSSITGRFPELEKELEQLIETKDANVVMLYSRRCLEVIITDLCESELKRPRKTEPLKGIIDKLNREEKVPAHIIASMHSLNSLSTFGAHPKEFDPEQVRPVLINLTTIIKWYLKYKVQKIEVTAKEKEEELEHEKPGIVREERPVIKSKNKPFIITSGILLIGVIIVFAFDVFNIFHKDKFENIRDEKGRISIAVMPFQNMTNDTLWNIWQGGIQNELITNLSNSSELSVRQYQTMLNILQSTGLTNYASITPSVAGDISRKLQATTFIQGSIKSAGGKIRVNAHLIDAETEEIYKTFQIDGRTEDDIFIMTDSLSGLVRNYLEIKALERDAYYGLSKLATTSSVEAYRYFIQGINFFIETNYSSSIELFNKALETDTNLIAARIYLTLAYGNQGMHEKAKQYLQEAYKQIDNLSYSEQLMLKYLKSYYDKDPYAGIKYMGLILEHDPQLRMWWQQGLNYYRIHQYEKAIQYFEKALEADRQWDARSKWPYLYTLPGEVYHKLGNHNREKEIYELGLSILPDRPEIIFRQAICALSQGDMTEAERLITKYLSLRKEEGMSESDIMNTLGSIYQEANVPDKAEVYFRNAYDLEPQNSLRIYQLAYHLINYDINVDEGMELIEKGLEQYPENPDLIQVKGWGFYKQGKPEEAMQLLKKAEEKNIVFNRRLYQQIQEVEQAIAN